MSFNLFISIIGRYFEQFDLTDKENNIWIKKINYKRKIWKKYKIKNQKNLLINFIVVYLIVKIDFTELKKSIELESIVRRFRKSNQKVRIFDIFQNNFFYFTLIYISKYIIDMTFLSLLRSFLLPIKHIQNNMQGHILEKQQSFYKIVLAFK